MGLNTALSDLLVALPPELSLAGAGQRMRSIVDALAASVPIGCKVTGHVGRGG